ncbi:hypothetical protein LINPERPRIM_LOCUS32678 [Linum perenne]
MEKERPHTYRYNRYKREHAETEDDRSGNSVTLGGVLETAKADRAVWLMKCPVAVARSWQTQASSSDSQPVAKVVVSLDPLQADESPQVRQFKMEMAGSEIGNAPKSYSLNMTKEFVPMCIFSEPTSGKVSVEGKVDHKFDLKPHGENIEEYGRLCRERTNRSMVKTRQIQVLKLLFAGFY